MSASTCAFNPLYDPQISRSSVHSLYMAEWSAVILLLCHASKSATDCRAVGFLRCIFLISLVFEGSFQVNHWYFRSLLEFSCFEDAENAWKLLWKYWKTPQGLDILEFIPNILYIFHLYSAYKLCSSVCGCVSIRIWNFGNKIDYNISQITDMTMVLRQVEVSRDMINRDY